jgi:hypothetical protein
MTQKTSIKKAAKKEEFKQPVSQAKATTVQKPQPEKGAPKPEEAKGQGIPIPKVVELKLSDIKLMLDALTASILEHTRQIAALQEALARKRKSVSNGKVQIHDKVSGRTYSSKNSAYQTLLKAGELQELVGKGIFGSDPAKNTFGWYALNRAWPDRFEEIKSENAGDGKQS